ncbi:MAG TPA: 16S rRNA (cytidine(1402)-2'-O)-methyltransferase [Gammaproteobacteria bacterium]|jgi:16S rRNA (cytidine1402-2'-O)-methyltransferase|nr:16S rRNA (cytidine(1402)-2'-O)-methyltransferase [Gammaproteobacteria bacterium]HIK76652.1 16S rRNA (cytidine(1402)-2'-O)-methyltransferase [Gammaproteobacteria bacterium]
MPGQLNIVSTPIGNLRDITFRAIEVLKSVDLILAEDTRVAKKLLNHYAIENKLTSFNLINENQKTKTLIKQLKEGKNIALIADAGTPLISDPGYLLIRSAREESIQVTPVPGCSAAIAALTASGISADKFTFYGFLPKTKVKRAKELRKLTNRSETLIFYESVHRIVNTIESMKEIFGENRNAVLCKEITKLYESFLGSNLLEISNYLSTNPDRLKGEFTIIVQGERNTSIDYEKIDFILSLLTLELSLKSSIKICAKITGYSKKIIYTHALEKQY